MPSFVVHLQESLLGLLGVEEAEDVSEEIAAAVMTFVAKADRWDVTSAMTRGGNAEAIELDLPFDVIDELSALRAAHEVSFDVIAEAAVFHWIARNALDADDAAAARARARRVRFDHLRAFLDSLGEEHLRDADGTDLTKFSSYLRWGRTQARLAGDAELARAVTEALRDVADEVRRRETDREGVLQVA